MTPARLAPLAARALGRTPTRTELQDWAGVLARVPDDIGDQALLDHRATSTYPPTLADVKRIATGLLNDRAMRAETEARRRERETGMTADGQPLVPMPYDVRALADQLAAKQRARDAALQPEPLTAGPETSGAPASHPCCAHCTGVAEHPPHRAACDLCPQPSSTPMDETTREAAL